MFNKPPKKQKNLPPFIQRSALNPFVLIVTFVVFPFTVRANSTGFIIGDLVTIRSSKNGSSVCKVLYGTNLTILEDDGTWMKVIYDGQNVGYVSSQYVAEYSKIPPPVFLKATSLVALLSTILNTLTTSLNVL